MKGKQEMTTNEEPLSHRPCEQAFADMMYWRWHGEPSRLSVLSAVGFMEKTLALAAGAKLLDLGCGLGHHAIELARRGYDVTALEWSEAFLALARRRAESASVSVEFVRADMTRLSYSEQFDAVVLWGNTFGMFSEEGNLRTLQGIARALKRRGLALIDTQNYTNIPEQVSRDWGFGDKDSNLLFLTEGTKDVLRARFGFNVLAIDLALGKRHQMPLSWRLYLLPELKRLLADGGLTLFGIYGDDPAAVDWKRWKRGEPFPYSLDGFTEGAAKRILLCQS